MSMWARYSVPGYLSRRGLTHLALAAGLVLFGPYFLYLFAEAAWPSLPAIPGITLTVLMTPFVLLWWFFSMPQFSIPGFYLWAGFGLAGLTLLALLRDRPFRRAHLLPILILLVAAAGPWVFPYRPAVVAAPGYQMLVPTQPDPIGGMTKRAQRFMEITPSRYTLLGWDDGDVLYYRDESKGSPSRIWAFAPGREELPREVVQAPPHISAEGQQSSVLGWVRSATSSPEHEPSDRSVKVRGGGLKSPSGRWMAVATRWIYGPEDVIVLSEG